MWSDWNWLNVFFMFLNGYLAYDFFEDDRDTLGWLNLFASALNAACVGVNLL